MAKPKWRRLIISYVLMLHLIAAILITKTDFIPKLQAKLRGETSRPFETRDFIQLMLTFHKRMDDNIPEASIVFFGDSIMQSLATGAVTSHAVNYGIGGETSRDLLDAIPQYEFSLKRARAIVIAIGVNDFINDIGDGFDERYAAIIRRLPPGKPLIISAIMPAELPKKSKLASADIARANAGLKARCSAHARCIFVDMWPLFMGPNNHPRRQYYMDDGIHLSPAGYRLWIQHLAQAVEVAAAHRH